MLNPNDNEIEAELKNHRISPDRQDDCILCLTTYPCVVVRALHATATLNLVTELASKHSHMPYLLSDKVQRLLFGHHYRLRPIISHHYAASQNLPLRD